MKFWPVVSDHHVIHLNLTSPTAEQLHLHGLTLHNGASYSVKVTAINRAKMATAMESTGVTVDTTPPVILKVCEYVGLESPPPLSRVYVCMYVCICVCTCVSTCVCVFARVRACVCVSRCVRAASAIV